MRIHFSRISGATDWYSSAGAGGRTTVRAASLVVGDVVFCFDGPKQLDAIDDLEGDFEVQAGRLS